MKKIAAYLYEKPAFLFLVFTAIAFLPVLLPLFYIKNDLVTQILPTRFVISESLHSGFFPWWNPYINYGIPQYSDMNCGFWNPLLWVIALVFRYNIWTITYEELFYIFLSGWGMYLVLKELAVSKKISIAGGLSYLCSGYIVGHMQHLCWITGAAFFPYVFLYFLRINKNPIAKNYITGSLFSFLFLSSAHPGLIIGALYFFILASTAIIIFKRSWLRGHIHPAIVRNNTIFLGLSLFLSACVIIGYAEAIPLITRGEKLPGANTVMNATTLQSYISLLFPLVVHKSAVFNTDISMRNMYTGLLALPGLYFFYKNSSRKLVLFTFSCLSFYILLSAGGVFKTIANNIIPLAGYVRSSGEFSLFSVFIMIVAGAAGFQTLATRNVNFTKRVGGLKILIVSFIVFATGSVILIFSTGNSFLFSIQTHPVPVNRESLKNAIAAASFWDLLFIQSCLNLVSVYFLFKGIKLANQFRITFIVVINLIVVCWLTLPFTGVGAKSKKEVNAMLSSAPEGIINQPLVPVNNFAITDTNYTAFMGLPYTYLKKMGTPAWNPYPIQLKNNADYFKDSQTVNFINQQAYLFMSSDTSIHSIINKDSSDFTIQATGPGYIKAMVRNSQFNYITLLQNDYLHWRVFIDGKKISHFTGYKTFISVAIPKKDFTIEYRFIPRAIIITACCELAILLIACLYILILWKRPAAAKNYI